MKKITLLFLFLVAFSAWSQQQGPMDCPPSFVDALIFDNLQEVKTELTRIDSQAGVAAGKEATRLANCVIPDGSGHTALMVAARSNSLDIVQHLLINYKVNVKMVDRALKNALMHAQESLALRPAVIKFLKKKISQDQS